MKIEELFLLGGVIQIAQEIQIKKGDAARVYKFSKSLDDSHDRIRQPRRKKILPSEFRTNSTFWFGKGKRNSCDPERIFLKKAIKNALRENKVRTQVMHQLCMHDDYIYAHIALGWQNGII